MLATSARSNGRWYWEMTARQDGGSSSLNCPVVAGLSSADRSTRVAGYGYHGTFGFDSRGSYGCTPSATVNIHSGDVVGVAWDAGAASVRFYRNGALTFTCSLPPGAYLPYGNHANDASYHCSGTTNFGASPFVHSP